MKPLALAAAIVLTLSGCLYQQHGNRFDTDAVARLTPGVSTKQDAIALLGQPTALSTSPDGSQILQWQYAYGTAIGVGGAAHAAIAFAPDGKMIRVTHLSRV
jgi:outer membrane protein assembly factor BamE (lipoprotein component of BamABCDE complex)